MKGGTIDIFKGNTAVITGAARGIGLALARRAAAEGVNLVPADIDIDAIDKATATLGVAPERLPACWGDRRNAEEIKRLADAAYDLFGAVQCVPAATLLQ